MFRTKYVDKIKTGIFCSIHVFLAENRVFYEIEESWFDSHEVVVHTSLKYNETESW